MRIRALGHWAMLTVYFGLLSEAMVASHLAKVPAGGLILLPDESGRMQMHWEGLQLRRSCIEDRCELFVGRDRGLELLASYPREATVEVTRDHLVHVWTDEQARDLREQRALASAVGPYYLLLATMTGLWAVLVVLALGTAVRRKKKGPTGSFVRVPNQSAGYRTPSTILRWLVASDEGIEQRLRATALTQLICAGLMSAIALVFVLI
jgi:hypothetical protein